MSLRVAAVSFLNTWPLIEDLAAAPGVQLQTALPSTLPRLLADDEADVALIPIFAYLEGTGSALVPGACIGAVGPVDSVKLFSRGDPAAMRTVLVDRGSLTSAALLAILLRERWGGSPRVEIARPGPAALEAHDGVLAIGDLCFALDREVRGRLDWQSHDLGGLWRELTGLPFVFAAWAVSAHYLERSTALDRADLVRILAAARDRGLARLEDLADRALAAGRLGVGGDATREAILYYLRESLHFRFGPEELRGVERFRGFCVDHGLLAHHRPLTLVGRDGKLTG